MSDLYNLPTLNAPIGAWSERAKCKGMDPHTFFPERGASHRDALAVCAECPVTHECLEYARTNGLRDGVFGGVTPRGRRGLPVKRRCLWCREQFEITHPGGHLVKFCSEPCRDSFRAEQQRMSRIA